MVVNIMIRVTIKRVQNKDSIDKLKAKLKPKVEAGLRAVAYKLKDMADALVPQDTTALIGGGKVRPFDGDWCLSFTVGYGTKGEIRAGYSKWHGGRLVFVEPAKYAVYVHEDITKHHDIGQAEYLATPLRTELMHLAQTFNQAFVIGV